MNIHDTRSSYHELLLASSLFSPPGAVVAGATNEIRQGSVILNIQVLCSSGWKPGASSGLDQEGCGSPGLGKQLRRLTLIPAEGGQGRPLGGFLQIEDLLVIENRSGTGQRSTWDPGGLSWGSDAKSAHKWTRSFSGSVRPQGGGGANQVVVSANGRRRREGTCSPIHYPVVLWVNRSGFYAVGIPRNGVTS